MNRHEGFTVFSPKDIDAYLGDPEKEALRGFTALIAAGRDRDNKPQLAAPIVVYTDSPVASDVLTLLNAQIQREVADFYQPVTAQHLLTIIESGEFGQKLDYFNDFITEGTGPDKVHKTPTGSVWSPATNMVQAFALAEQFGVMVGNVLAEKPVSIVAHNELEAYALPAGDEETYSNRLNETIVFAVRRSLQANHNVDFSQV